MSVEPPRSSVLILLPRVLGSISPVSDKTPGTVQMADAAVDSRCAEDEDVDPPVFHSSASHTAIFVLGQTKSSKA